MQLISKLLDVEFDAIWQRHKRLMIQKAVAWSVGIIVMLATLFGVWIKNQPVDVEMKLNEVSFRNESLPPLKDAIVTMTLENEIKTDTVSSLNEHAIFNNIPQKFIGKTVNVKVICEDYLDVDTTLLLANCVTIDIERNPKVYGNVQFDIWDDSSKGVANVVVDIAGNSVVSDENGHVELFIPLEKQQDKYHIISSVVLAKDTIYMPCSESDIISVK